MHDLLYCYNEAIVLLGEIASASMLDRTSKSLSLRRKCLPALEILLDCSIRVIGFET